MVVFCLRHSQQLPLPYRINSWYQLLHILQSRIDDFPIRIWKRLDEIKWICWLQLLISSSAFSPYLEENVHPYVIFLEIHGKGVKFLKGFVVKECVIDGLLCQSAVFPYDYVIKALLVDEFWFYQRLVMPKWQYMHLTYEIWIVWERFICVQTTLLINFISKQWCSRGNNFLEAANW